MSAATIALCLEYSLFAYGGTEVLVAELIRQLAPRYRILLASNDSSLSGSWAESLVARHHSWTTATGDPRNLIAWLEQQKASLVHFHLGDNYCWKIRNPLRSPVTLAGRSGLRVVTTNHGFFSPFQGYCAHYRPFALKLLLFPAAWWAKLQQLHVTRLEIAVSRYDYRRLCAYYAPYASRFRWVHHSQLGVEIPQHRVPRQKRVLCVGTIGHRKGQPLLIEAFADVASKHPDWDLELAGRAGEPQMLAAMEDTIRRAGLEKRVRRTEGLDHAAIVQRLATSEIFAMPSRFEGLGLSLQEALFHGCACVSTRSGGPEDLIQPGHNGLLTPRTDRAALARALDLLMGDGALRQRFRAAGPASIRSLHMSGVEMAERYHSIYQRLLPA